MAEIQTVSAEPVEACSSVLRSPSARPSTGSGLTDVTPTAAHIRFAGYAAIFGRIDRGGDIIRRGAFARSLAKSGGKLPLLWQHRPDKVIGHVTYSAEDSRGLRVIGEIDAAQYAAAQTHGLSFGYRVRRSEGQSPRELAEVELLEISLVQVPMMPLSRIHLYI